MIQDVIGALSAYLKTIAAIQALVGGAGNERIFVGEMPEGEVVSMPRPVIVLRYAGGVEAFRSSNLQDPRIDVWCYGERYHDAGQVDGEVVTTLRALRRLKQGPTFIHSMGIAGGPFQLREPDTGWPYVVRSYTAIADERVAV